jgi:hypothetical protein
LAFLDVHTQEIPAMTHSAPFHQPYPKPALNELYNLLFADDPALFGRSAQNGTPFPLTAGHAADWMRAAANESLDSRWRLLAMRLLAAEGHPVPQKQVFGVVIEVPMEGGLDALAAYADGGVRFINHSGRASIFEGATHPVAALGQQLVTAAQVLAQAIGPWEGQRPAPPTGNLTRINLLVSDGLYFGQAPFNALMSDAMGRPVLSKAVELLQAVVRVAA